MGTCLKTTHNTLEKIPSKGLSIIPFMKKHELGADSYSRRKQIRKLVHSSEGSRSLNRRIELKFGGVVDMGILQQMNG